jgi:ABC-type transporter Mla subunit MlaD
MDGFGNLASEQNTVEEALRTSSSQTETAFDNLEAGVKDVGDKFTEAANDTSSKLDAAKDKAEDDETLVEETGKECDAALDTEQSETVQACESFEQSAKQYYEGEVDGEVSQDAEGLNSGAAGVIDTAGDEIQSEVADDLEAPLDSVFEDSFDPHKTAVDEIDGDMWDIRSTGASLVPLVDNLVKAEGIVEVIAELNAAMG